MLDNVGFMKTADLVIGIVLVSLSLHAAPVMMPVIDGEWWTVAW